MNSRSAARVSALISAMFRPPSCDDETLCQPPSALVALRLLSAHLAGAERVTA